MAGNPLHQRGLSLIELAAVMAITALLLGVAMPAFTDWIRNSQVRAAAETLESGLQFARVEAIRRNRSVQFQLTSSSTSSWTVGCANPVDGGTVGVDDALGDCPETIRARNAAEVDSDQAQITPTPSDAATVTFNSLGRVVGNVDGSSPLQRVDLNTSASGTRALRVVIGAGGSIRSCDPSLSSPDPRAC
jgi:type IV fimbrial biogenesis protein FimT